MAILPDNYEQIKRASDAAFEAYRQHVPYGEGGNETAVKAGREAWQAAIDADRAELTETLKRMRQMTAHNYPSKEQLNGGNADGD